MKIIWVCFILASLLSKIYAQIDNLYIPVTINAPLFKNNKCKELQIGSKINNYGLHINFAGQSKSKILIFSIQQNNGNIKFDPLNFNEYYIQGQDKHLIQTYPTKMLYCELGVGYNLNMNKQKLSFLSGVGQQFLNKNTRYFIQLDFGKENKLINVGVSLRGNYAKIQNQSFFTLEPLIQGKVKIWKLRIVNQFEYCIAINKGNDYMKPVFTIGLEFIL